MTQSTRSSALHDLGYKIFLDRYALKDMTRETLTVGDTVVALVDPDTRQREIGTVEAIDLPQITITLRDGTVVTCNIEEVDKPLETDPDQMMDRVARGVAAVEATEDARAQWAERFRWLLDDWKFVPGGRILAAAGTDQQLTYYNCYVVPMPHDSRDGIIETLRQMTEIMSRGGGVGINISSLRPRYAYVRGVNGRSSGTVSWGELYSFVTGLIEQGGSRRGALMVILNDWHPDIYEFVNVKRNMDRMTNANISVGVSDRLMEAVENDSDWDLVFPDTDEPGYDDLWDGDLGRWIAEGHKIVHYDTVKARDLWNAIIESAWASAEPGIWFRERTNKFSNSYYFSPLICTNPCGEQPLSAWSVCNLGAINLARFYDAESGDVAWDDLRMAARCATRFLDNVIDTTPYFFEENRQQQLSERRVGLGTMGLAELMIRLGLRYGSDESLAFIDKLYEYLATTIYEMSTEIAQEKESFPQFDAELFLQSGYMQQMPERIRDLVRERGIRNVTLMTQAPTGTTGTLVNTSTGIEPFFSWSYFRKSRLGMHEEQVPLVRDWYAAHPEATELPDYFVTAMDLTPLEHVKVQAAIQRWVDSAISKTSNVPNEYTVEQTRELYESMYRLGCKGGTIYRDGSRNEQVLMLKEEEKADMGTATANNGRSTLPEMQDIPQVASPNRVDPRPKMLTGVTVSVKTPFGTGYITMNTDEEGNPFEVFVTIGKAGSDLQADAEGLGRMISLLLRTTARQNRLEMLKLIIDQLRNIGGVRSVGLGNGRVSSLPDAVASTLEHFYLQRGGEQLQLPGLADGPQPVSQSGESALAGSPGTPHGSVSRSTGAKRPSGMDMCPACGTISLVRAEGCQKCLACGYSEC